MFWAPNRRIKLAQLLQWPGLVFLSSVPTWTESIAVGEEMYRLKVKRSLAARGINKHAPVIDVPGSSNMETALNREFQYQKRAIMGSIDSGPGCF